MQALVVDDSAIFRKLITDYLVSWGFGVTVAENGTDAQRILGQPDAPRLVLLDWVLPDIDGTELCKRIRKDVANENYTYVILLTGKEGRQNMLEAMDAGADDYLEKPFDDLELKARLVVGKRILDLHQQLVSARESMRHAATHDSLTSLLNRGAILSTLERELVRGQREHTPVGIILGDIDHFKNVNDTLGHLFGDEALREIGRCLRDQLRIYDSVGRYGGEEFLMVLPNCNWQNTMSRANELREFIAQTPVNYSGVEKLVSMSMGVSVAEGGAKTDTEILLNHADAGLYSAKAKGRNRVERFSDPAKKIAAARKK
jgi:two-component system cell cycle response regulator